MAQELDHLDHQWEEEDFPSTSDISNARNYKIAMWNICLGLKRKKDYVSGLIVK